MNLVAQAKERLPRPVKAALRPLYRKGRDILSPAVVLDKELLRDTMEYFNLTKDEVITIAKLRHKLNAMLWNALNPTTEQEIRRFYQITPFYICELQQWHGERRRREFRAEVLEIASGDVLDYGGGIGDLCLKLAEKGLNVTYGDVSGVTFEFAKWLFKRRGYNIEVIDLEKKALSKHYDTIICIDVIHQIPQPGAVLERMASSLNKDGKLIITCLHCQQDKSHPMSSKMGFDAEELLNSLGLAQTDKKWLWVKADAKVPVEQGLARQHRIGVK